eukprot:FR738023.1.p1 GENE.FR738023.1~~FR738023.1.p1  ORF type:complete len:351 (+),score=28.42 FR738023.1:38-1090(+)
MCKVATDRVRQIAACCLVLGHTMRSVRAVKWLAEYDSCYESLASMAVVSPMEVCVQSELKVYQKSVCTESDDATRLAVQTSYWSDSRCRGIADEVGPVRTYPVACTNGRRKRCVEEHSDVARWPAVAKYTAWTGTCGHWADQVVAYNPNCSTVDSGNFSYEARCRHNFLIYSEVPAGNNCSTGFRDENVIEKYRLNHCSTSLSRASSDMWKEHDGKFKAQFGRMRVDGFGFGLDSVNNMYYASCGGASALPGVISPNDSVDYVSKLRWWQILLISLGALLVIVLALPRRQAVCKARIRKTFQLWKGMKAGILGPKSLCPSLHNQGAGKKIQRNLKTQPSWKGPPFFNPPP